MSGPTTSLISKNNSGGSQSKPGDLPLFRRFRALCNSSSSNGPPDLPGLPV